MSISFFANLARPIQQFFLGALCFFALNVTQASDTLEDKSAIKGSLFIIGGALRADNALVWQRLVAQAGGQGAKIAIIPAAAGNPEASGKAIAEILGKYGAHAFVLPLSLKDKQHNYQEIARDPDWIKQLREAGGVYFTGGDQGRITQTLLQPDGSKTPMLEAIWDIYRKGAVIAGSSAGAAIMSSTMFYDAKAVLPTLKLGVADGKEIAAGLGFIGPEVFVDQHLIIRGRFARMLPVMLKKNYKLGLGIDENTAMLISNQTEVEVIGYKGAILIDLSAAKTNPQEPDFNVSNVKISYLDRGDKFNLTSMAFTPPPDKVNGLLKAAEPYYNEALFYPDILANTTLVDLMSNLIHNKHAHAIGLAFSDGSDTRPDLGFEFKFSRTADSRGYLSNASVSYSVLNIRLDVRPVKMQLPLYR